MALEVKITGAATFHQVAARMRAEGRKDLSRDMGAAIARAAEPVKVAITREAEKVMPNEGGYRELLTGSLKHRQSRRLAGQQAQVIIATYADGTKERRDIVALNKGNLRHPIFGRSYRYKVGARAGSIRRNGWAVTRIRAGFHDRGVAEAADLAQAQLIKVVEEFAGRLAGK
jgi:hypothetical protein